MAIMSEAEGEGFLSGGLAGAGTGASIGFAVGGGPVGAGIGAVVGFIGGGMVGYSSAKRQEKAEEEARKEAERLRIEAVTKEMGRRQQAAQMQLAGLQRPSSSNNKSMAVNSSTGFMGEAVKPKSASGNTGTF